MLTEQQKKLAVDNMRLVHYLINRFGMNTYRNVEDLTSAGMIGLVKAASLYDEKYNVKFSTLASRCIINEILMQIRADRKLLRSIYLEDLAPDRSHNKRRTGNVEEFTWHMAYHDKYLFFDMDLLPEILSVLSDLEREVLIHVFIHERRQKEFQAMKGFKNQAYVSKLLKRSVEKIQKKYRRMMIV